MIMPRHQPIQPQRRVTRLKVMSRSRAVAVIAVVTPNSLNGEKEKGGVGDPSLANSVEEILNSAARHTLLVKVVICARYCMSRVLSATSNTSSDLPLGSCGLAA
jgi:hypothetical protein